MTNPGRSTCWGAYFNHNHILAFDEGFIYPMFYQRRFRALVILIILTLNINKAKYAPSGWDSAYSDRTRGTASVQSANYQGECQQETMLAIIYLWPTQDSPMHPLVLQCTLEQEPSLNFPSHWSRWQNWMSTQPVQSSTTFNFTATWRPQSRRLHEHSALWLAR